jgi:hypothetical protein
MSKIEWPNTNSILIQRIDFPLSFLISPLPEFRNADVAQCPSEVRKYISLLVEEDL